MTNLFSRLRFAGASFAITLAAHGAGPQADGTLYFLADFGPSKTVAEAEATYEAAIQKIQESGGGILVLPTDAPAEWLPEAPLQEMIRIPEAPAPAKSWKHGPGLTILDPRTATVLLPPATGMKLSRNFQLPQGQGSPHWRYHPLASFTNNLIGGTSSVETPLLAPVDAGADQRFFVRSLAGIFPHQTLEATLPDGSSGGSLKVKSLGFDAAKKQGFFLADSPSALAVGTTLGARSTMGILHARILANDQLQTFDVYNIREQFSQGDSYLYHGRIHYYGDEYSPREDPAVMGVDARSGFGSTIYDARISTDTNIFRGIVSAGDVEDARVDFKEGINTETLAMGRPLINLNPSKTITEGRAYLYFTPARLGYPGILRSKDAPWTPEVVGRYFAFDEPTEYVPTGDNVRRWYLITGFEIDPEDGSKCLTVRRHWWGAKEESGITRLYGWDNYTFDKKKDPVLLKYIIAPGAYVYEVKDALPDEHSGRLAEGSLKVAPHPWMGTRWDFEAGDPIEQAVGAEPFNPVPFRAWMWDQVPGEWPAPVFDVANFGATPRSSVVSVKGLNFGSVVEVSTESTLETGVLVQGDVNNAFIEMHQHPDGGTKPLNAFAWPNMKKRLGLNPATGALDFNGTWDVADTGLIEVAGISFRQGTAANNLRGVKIPVPAGVAEFEVVFPVSEHSPGYSVIAQPGWFTDHAVVNKTANGFVLNFTTPSPNNASLDWMIIR